MEKQYWCLTKYGDTDTLEDGTEIGLRDATYTERTDRQPSAEFYLGADSIIFGRPKCK